jgi:hypothetical protein
MKRQPRHLTSSIGRILIIAGACLVEVALIVGLVVVSLGLGYEGQGPVGTGGSPPPPVTTSD